MAMANHRLSRALRPATSYWIVVALFQMVHSHVLPRATPTVPLREFDVDLWPPAPTNAPLPSNDLLRRQFNTICGYIGGNPELPATCSAGSHCAADSQYGVIGCCPDEGPCTEGIFTSCVDQNSDPQTEINPYVFTCRGGDVCYQNQFDGGFSQYGCGSASSLANTVAAAPSGLGQLDIVSVSVGLTASATSLSEPTTIGTRTRSRTTDSSSEGSSSSTSTSRSLTSEERTASSSETSTSETSTFATTSSSDLPNIATDAGSAPDNNDEGTNVGAIVGGAIGGIAGIAMLVTLVIWLWRRKSRNSRQGPGLNQSTEYITPMTDNRQQFTQLPTTWEETEPEAPSQVPKTYAGIRSTNTAGNATQHDDSYSNSSVRGMAVGGSRPYEQDQEPLTGELADFSRGFNTALDDVDSNDDTQPNSQGMGGYTRTRDGGRPLWQQNRRRSRDIMWI